MLAVYRIASLRNDAVSRSRLQFTADTLGWTAVPAYIGVMQGMSLVDRTKMRGLLDDECRFTAGATAKRPA